MHTTTEVPALTPEQEKRFDERFVDRRYSKSDQDSMFPDGSVTDIKKYLAQELALQQAECSKRVEEIREKVESIYQASLGLRMEYKKGQAVDLLVGISALRESLSERRTT